MKNIALLLFACLPAFWMSAQPDLIPDVDLRDVNGNQVSSLDMIHAGAPTLLVFWKSTSRTCCENIEMLQETWESELKQRGVRMIAICVDCNGSWGYVKPLVNGNNWDFDNYVDVNGDLKRAMNVGEVPCTMLFDSDQQMICRYNSGYSGSQAYICKNILDHLNVGEMALNFKGE